MQLEDIKTVGVIGAGTMGQGIAQVAAMAGYSVKLYDLNADMLKVAQNNITANLDKGIARGKVSETAKGETLERIVTTNSLDDMVGELMIEAIVERLDVKQKLFANLEGQNSPDALLATNTSSIPITQIAAKLKHPGRMAGMHFFNPAHIMKLVEIISGAATSTETANLMKAFAEKLGKKAVMAADSPGFIVNRVARHFYVEGLKVMEDGVANYDAIDRLVEASGFRMGPFRLMDLIGVDTNFSVTSSMFNAFHQDGKFRPSRIQQQKVDAGHHGRKSGKGFYDYE